MPAEYEDGFSVREAMWHGLGTVVPEYMDRREAFPLSGQDWTVERAPLFMPSRVTLSNSVPVEGFFAARRSDTGHALAVHLDSYEVLQNSEGWDLADAIVNQDAAIQYETAGVLKGGRVCWVMLRDESFSVAGDKSKTIPFTLVSWAHDGSASMVATATNIRVVCWNTLTFALGEGQQRLAFRHTKNVRDRIEDAKKAVSGMRENTQLYRSLAESLSGPKLPLVAVEQFVSSVAGVTDPDYTRRKNRLIADRRAKLTSLLTGPTVEGSASSGWDGYDLLQAGVEFLDYVKAAKSDESRFDRTFLGSNDPKDKLLTTVRTLAGV